MFPLREIGQRIPSNFARFVGEYSYKYCAFTLTICSATCARCTRTMVTRWGGPPLGIDLSRPSGYASSTTTQEVHTVMADRKTTNILLAILVALQIWQVAASTPLAGAGDTQEVEIVGHSISRYLPLPVMIIEK